MNVKSNFNSIKVQLKHGRTELAQMYCPNFNSIKVQLKHY